MTEHSAPTGTVSKEHLFAIGVLCALGCSREYAEAIVERVLAPGALLNAGDAQWLARIHEAQRMTARAINPRWTHAN